MLSVVRGIASAEGTSFSQSNTCLPPKAAMYSVSSPVLAVGIPALRKCSAQARHSQTVSSQHLLIGVVTRSNTGMNKTEKRKFSSCRIQSCCQETGA